MKSNEYLIEQNTALNELHFMVAGKLYNNDVNKLFDVLMKAGLDDNCIGFWVWDLQNGVELYSPGFRTSLQYSGEYDFPSVPDSWRNAIDKKDLKIAMDNYVKHVESGGESKYIQKVRYYKKYKGHLDVICQGKIVAWDGDNPKIMIGVHMDISGTYKPNKVY